MKQYDKLINKDPNNQPNLFTYIIGVIKPKPVLIMSTIVTALQNQCEIHALYKKYMQTIGVSECPRYSSNSSVIVKNFNEPFIVHLKSLARCYRFQFIEQIIPIQPKRTERTRVIDFSSLAKQTPLTGETNQFHSTLGMLRGILKPHIEAVLLNYKVTSL